VVDGNGPPLSFQLGSASRAEMRLAQQTLDTIRVARSRGRPTLRSEKKCAERGHDGSEFRRVPQNRCIRMGIPPGAVPNTRWPSEAERWWHAKTTICCGSTWNAA
jgi:hypothetical protein